MITQPADPQHHVRTARQIKAQMPVLLSQWGLVAKFKRWRLAKDPKTGMVILFAVLDNKYIASHTTTPFSNYFDPHLLRDLETELQVQIVYSTNDGLRYAFILERGQIDELPKPIDPHPDKPSLVVKVLFSEKPAAAGTNAPALLKPVESDEPQVDRSVGSYLNVFKDIESGTADPKTVTQSLPNVVIEVKNLDLDQ